MLCTGINIRLSHFINNARYTKLISRLYSFLFSFFKKCRRQTLFLRKKYENILRYVIESNLSSNCSEITAFEELKEYRGKSNVRDVR